MAIILAGAPIKNYEFIKPLLKNSADPFIICADGGTLHAKALGITPHLIIGDMDSINHHLLEEYEKKGTKISKFPIEKDEIDTELAIKEAVALGHDQLTLLGVTGGRLDQTLANIHLLVYAAQLGAEAVIIDEENHLCLITPQQQREIMGNEGDTISLIPLTTQVTGVSTRGLKWELTNRVFAVGKPYGISNKFTGKKAVFQIEDGLLLLIRPLKEVRCGIKSE